MIKYSATDNFILTKNGLKKNNDITRLDEVWGSDGWVKINNTKQTTINSFKIITKFGNEIILALEQNIETIKGKIKHQELLFDEQITMIYGSGFNQKEIVKLENIDDVIFKGNVKDVYFPSEITKEFAYILGYMYGDGCIHKRFSKETNNHTGTFFSLACALDRPDIIEKLKNNWLEVFKCEIKEYSTEGNWLNLKFSSQKLYQFLLKNEIAKEKAGYLKFPNKILNSPIDIQLAFISGYFDADGYASDKKRGFVFASIDLYFLKTIKYILASIGILTKIHIEDRSSKNWQTLYTLVIVGATSKIKFKEALTESLKMVKTEIHSNRDCFVTTYRSSELLIDNYNNYSYMPDNTQYVSLNCIRKLKENNVKIKIENPVLYQDFIKEITLIGETEIIELDVDSDSGIFINGFLI